MLSLLWLIPALPLAGFTFLALFGGRLPRAVAAAVGVGSVGLSTVVASLVGVTFLNSPPDGHFYRQTLWTWMDVGGFHPDVAFYLDALSLVMMLVVTWVGALIHLYSSEFMAGDEGYSRFFAYMNLFVSSMLVLLLADNLLLLYLGWEGVGLCSYLLIGFWYSDPANGRAARKAFLVTRVGDTAMAIGLFLLFAQLGTLEIQDLMGRASAQWVGSPLAVAAAALLLGGAVGKSAQLPLQTWLPDAMAGPSPVSALIHAATMVTAGVYLIARTHVLFELAPSVQAAVAVVGTLTLLLAGFSALTQFDLKRVLAYSTISQIGYMFLALGVGAWSSAIFHFMTHAFFKALLFLGAGVVILKMHHEHDMFKMGGLRTRMPVTFWTFLAGSASLAAIPLVTAGFYSKDQILWDAWASERGSAWLWAGGVAGALLTSVYTFRMVFVTFYGERREGQGLSVEGPRPEATHYSDSGSGPSTLDPRLDPSDAGWRMTAPLVVLGVLSVIGGFLELPPLLGGWTPFSEFLHTALPSPVLSQPGHGEEFALQLTAAVLSLGGIYIAWRLYLKHPETVESLTTPHAAKSLRRFWLNGWGFDWLYDRLFVWPYAWLARVNAADVFDLMPKALAWIGQTLNRVLVQVQTGRLRTYAAGIALGAIVAIAIVLFL